MFSEVFKSISTDPPKTTIPLQENVTVRKGDQNGKRPHWIAGKLYSFELSLGQTKITDTTGVAPIIAFSSLFSIQSPTYLHLYLLNRDKAYNTRFVLWGRSALLSRDRILLISLGLLII